ncbi:unnamed protein product, partial [Schistosoma turkestanicum]
SLHYAKIKQWLSWSLRLMPTNHHSNKIDAKKNWLYRNSVEHYLTAQNSSYFITGTPNPTIADICIAYTLKQFTDYSQWISSSSSSTNNKHHIIAWFDNLT